MIGVIIVTALVALMQVSASRAGQPSPLTTTVTSTGVLFEDSLSAVVSAARGTGQTIASLPALQASNGTLRERNAALEAENARLNEAVAAANAQTALAPRLAEYPGAIPARVIGFPPENGIQSVMLDKGTRAGVHRDDGVLAAQGVVGRVVEAGPFSSKVSLLTDFTSTIPAIVQRGRYWGVAKGNQTSVRLDYVSQDAPLRSGDRVVTGEARSFHSGALIGTIVAIERGDSSLYQTAVLKPAVDFSRIDRVVILPK
ncbi:MAG: rod shape-determining protein MreC [Candidatus Baltobacteraceae bacterium]